MKPFLFLLIIAAGCTLRPAAPTLSSPQARDTMFVVDTLRLPPDTVYAPPDTVVIVRTVATPELLRRIDSMHHRLFVAEYRVARVRHYLNICLRNPSQDKFLKGWIKRAIE